MSVTWRQVAAWRTRRHGLDARRPAEEASAVVSRLCGLHAQLMSSAEATLRARVDGLPDDAVERALWTDRTLVKTWSMRGTLHLLPAAEYPLWQAGFATYRHYLKPVWLRNFHITAEELTTLVDAVGEVLADRVLTRAELADEVAARTSAHIGEKLRESWGAYLKPASFQGRLVFGPGEGQFVRFTAPRTWLGVDLAAREGAVEEIALRFLAQQGPATREDFARWWGVSPADGGRVFKALGDRIEPVDVEGAACWARAEDVASLREAEPVKTVRLLPAFDQYVVAATRHATHLLDGGSPEKVYRPQGWLSPVLMVDGMLAGVWSQERKGGRVAVTLEPFRSLSAAARKTVLSEVDRMAGPTEVHWVG
ncbi:winged helix DNA-binding domain-containing protein [Saccharothrix luteola]|uniref:winged helix DNA-binding domain-containing protein n=1 Tax=Saccharothrix luteola TaxID=2893018 RepID=UPI001E4C6BF8|nr:winged helix DNA-binding domain-containing protein [Saccharothrix luteola]MCC8245100.1 winged helix DNA-binding domain-containing protein [Saccharothrix luteola]